MSRETCSLPLAMSTALASAYNSDSDNEDADENGVDVFGLSKIPLTKKSHTEDAVVAVAAPHVLAEVS